MSITHLTDCKSLYDLLHKRGTVPSERRLVIDIEALRDDLESNNVRSKWVSTRQMLADCLTKDDPRAADYLKFVLRTGRYCIVEDTETDSILREQKELARRERRKMFEEKYPNRKRPAKQEYTTEGKTYYADVVAEVARGARSFRLPAAKDKRWRWTLAQFEGKNHYVPLEEMVDWSRLGEKLRRRKLPPGIDKLLTVHGPTRTSLEEWSEDFRQGHDMETQNKNHDMEAQNDNTENPTESDDEGLKGRVLPKSDEDVEVPRDDDHTALCLWAFSTVAVSAGSCCIGAAAAKSANFATSPVPESSAGSSAPSMPRPKPKAAPKSKAAPQATPPREAVVAAPPIVATPKAGAPTEASPPPRIAMACMHPRPYATTGSNQYREKLWCKACGGLVSDLETPWWAAVKSQRAHQAMAQRPPPPSKARQRRAAG